MWSRRDKEGSLKAEDVTAYQRCYSHGVHDKGDNTSNLLSHLKMYCSTLHVFVKLECQHSLKFVQIKHNIAVVSTIYQYITITVCY